MPVIKSAKKKLRRDQKRQKINAKFKNLLSVFVKKARRVPAAKTVLEAVRMADKAAKKNIIHRKKAARIKSSLMTLLNKKSTQKQTSAKQKSPSKKSKK